MRAIDFERARKERAPRPTGYVAAMASARAEFPDIPKNREAVVRMKSGGTYKFKYADLSDILDATVPALSAYGLIVDQGVEGAEVETVIEHADGEARKRRWPI